MQAEIQSLQIRIQTYEGIINDQEKTIDQYKKKLADSEVNYSEKLQKEFQKELERKDTEITDLKVQLQKAINAEQASQVHRITAENELENKVRRLEKALADERSKVEFELQSIKLQRASMEELVLKDNKAYKNEIESLKKEVLEGMDAKSKLRQVEAENAALLEKINLYFKKDEEKSQRIDELNKEVSTLKDRLYQLERERPRILAILSKLSEMFPLHDLHTAPYADIIQRLQNALEGAEDTVAHLEELKNYIENEEINPKKPMVIKETIEIDTTPVKKGTSAVIVSKKADVGKSGQKDEEEDFLKSPPSELSRNSVISEDQSSNFSE